MNIAQTTQPSMPISKTSGVQEEQRPAVEQSMQQAVQNAQKAQREAESKKVSTEDVQLATEKANKLAGVFNRNLKFEYKEEAGMTQVTVWDTDKSEVIRKIPSDEMVRFVERIQDLLGATLDAFV